ncbi:MAG: molecular chaperone HtpG [Chloroflexota bacterium]
MSQQESYTFQAEIKQLLDILVHSLYTEREIFLRELISNASDALNRVQFEMLTNRDVTSPDAELRIDITADEDAGTLTISDTGIGMTREDMVNNLGVIARSGAKAFVNAMREASKESTPVSAQDVIGQFGVGFYSVFMVANRVRVVSKSYKPDEPAVAWEATGGEEYTIEEADRTERGTSVIVYLNEDDREFLQKYRISQIIRTHSDYIAFPIYVNSDEKPVNKQTAIWRRSPAEVEDQEYNDFYKMMTMDFNEPLHRIHMRADVPLQFYALLYIPSSAEPNMFSPRKEAGLKLYARKVLIQEYNRDILPEYLSFVQGVVDTEDLPLNVSRESVQANRVMATLSKTITSKVLSELKRLARKDEAQYLSIFGEFSRYIKQGLVVAPQDKDDILPLLYFNTTHDDDPEAFYNLDTYVDRMVSNQQDIYYIVADDWHSARRSPHLDAFRQRGIEVLYFTDPVDAAMLMGLESYKDHTFRSVDEAGIDLNDIGELQEETQAMPEAMPEADFEAVIGRFKSRLGGRVRDVRPSKTLAGSPARLISEESGAARNMFRINRMLDREYELPVKILELNPRHQLLHNLHMMIAQDQSPAMVDAVVEQVFETALLQDGIHPDPAAMAERLTLLMQAATGTAVNELDFENLPQMQAPPAEQVAMGPDISDAEFSPVGEAADTSEDDASDPAEKA